MQEEKEARRKEKGNLMVVLAKLRAIGRRVKRGEPVYREMAESILRKEAAKEAA